MIRAIFTGFLAFLLLMTWADDIYSANQIPDDPADECCSFDNDNFLPCEVQHHSLIKTVADLPFFQGLFDANEGQSPFILSENLLAPAKLRPSVSLFYIFMSLLR